MGDLTGYDDWMVEQNLSDNTRKQRLNFAVRVRREWGTFDITGTKAVAWLNQYEGWTWHTYLNHIRAVYDFLLETGAVEADPLARVKAGAPPPPAPRPLSARERDLALTSCDGDLLAYCLLGYQAGLRVHEVAKLRGEDVTASHIRVVGKGRKTAEIPIHDDLWALAQSYPRRGFWFPSARSRDHLQADTITVRVTHYFRSLGIQTGSHHRLRHTFATDLARAGVHPRTIQQLMRHASLEVTMRYLEASDEDKRRAVSALSRPRLAA